MELELNKAQVELLRVRAESLGVSPAELARAAVTDLLARQDEEFENALRHILDENEELYRRLA